MKEAKNLVGRLEGRKIGALQGLGRVKGYGLLKSRVFASASLVL